MRLAAIQGEEMFKGLILEKVIAFTIVTLKDTVGPVKKRRLKDKIVSHVGRSSMATE